MQFETERHISELLFPFLTGKLKSNLYALRLNKIGFKYVKSPKPGTWFGKTNVYIFVFMIN